MCAKYFLAHNRIQHGKVIDMLLKATTPTSITPSLDKRGKHNPHHKMPNDDCFLITKHIKSYNPSVSHYRHEHSNRQCLSSEVTIRSMLDELKREHPSIKCCFET